MGLAARDQIVRLWQMVRLLNEHRHGLRSVALAEKLECSLPTVNRALNILRQAGVCIETVSRGEERYHKLSDKPLPPLSPTPLQMAALQIAAVGLRPLEGTGIYREFQGLLKQPPDEPTTAPLSLRPGPSHAEVVRTIDGAMTSQHRLRLSYRASSRAGQTKIHEVDPIRFRLVKDDLYLLGFDHGSEQLKTFKVARISEAEFLKTKAARHPDIEPQLSGQRSIKAWTGPQWEICVELAPEVAYKAKEYPLVDDQLVETLADGGARITARVAGLVEAKQWVLGWGAAATAIAPPELRRAVHDELRAALGPYQGPQPRTIAGEIKAPRTRAAARPLARARNQDAARDNFESAKTGSAHRR